MFRRFAIQVIAAVVAISGHVSVNVGNLRSFAGIGPCSTLPVESSFMPKSVISYLNRSSCASPRQVAAAARVRSVGSRNRQQSRAKGDTGFYSPVPPLFPSRLIRPPAIPSHESFATCAPSHEDLVPWWPGYAGQVCLPKPRNFSPISPRNISPHAPSRAIPLP